MFWLAHGMTSLMSHGLKKTVNPPFLKTALTTMCISLFSKMNINQYYYAGEK